MRRLLVIIIAISVILTFVGCGNSNGNNEDNVATVSSESVTKATELQTEISTNTSTNNATDISTEKTTEKFTEKPTERQTEIPTTVEAQTTHTHTWEDITTTVHHDAVTREKWVVDEPAKNIYIDVRQYWCQYCSCSWSYSSQNNDEAYLNRILEDMDNHLVQCIKNWEADEYRMAFNYPKINVSSSNDTVRIDEKGHYETETIQAAYDEEKIIGKKCTGCGETVMI